MIKEELNDETVQIGLGDGTDDEIIQSVCKQILFVIIAFAYIILLFLIAVWYCFGEQ